MPQIIYMDRAVLVCCKPVGVISEPDGGKGLPELLRAQLREAKQRDFIAGVHRLDKNVGGLMVFSRRKDITGRLIAQVAAHRMQKEYLAVLRGVPEAAEGMLEDLLFHDSRTNKTFVVTRQRKGVRDARLSYRVLTTTVSDGVPLSLVRVRLHTGRTHQIRVQFAARSLPLLGDIRYGSRDRNCDVSLFSYRLGFSHPETGEALQFTCPPPAQYPWNLFPMDTLLSETDDTLLPHTVHTPNEPQAPTP